MKISKLTITPLETGCPSFSILNPSTKDATMMISQRLSHEKAQYNTERPLRKMSKWLREFANPNALVVKERKFDVNA